jgi:hypothetical protein
MVVVPENLSVTSIDEAAKRLVQYIESLPDFVYFKCDDPYGHIGATVADAVLQANNKYGSHVEPRVRRIMASWPNEKTVSQVLTLLDSVSPTEYLDWSGDRASRFFEILSLLKQEGVESESDLRAWLEKTPNLAKLDGISGVGDKTIDYLRIMVGLQGVAIDRRVLRFLEMAGIVTTLSNYSVARDIVNRAADVASVPRRDFDHSIWRYVGDHEGKACA